MGLIYTGKECSPTALTLECSWKNIGIYLRPIHKQQRRNCSAWQPHKVSLAPPVLHSYLAPNRHFSSRTRLLVNRSLQGPDTWHSRGKTQGTLLNSCHLSHKPQTMRLVDAAEDLTRMSHREIGDTAREWANHILSIPYFAIYCRCAALILLFLPLRSFGPPKGFSANKLCGAIRPQGLISDAFLHL